MALHNCVSSSSSSTSTIAISSSSSATLCRASSSPYLLNLKRARSCCSLKAAHISLNRLYLQSFWAYQKRLFTSSLRANLSDCGSCISSFDGDGPCKLEQNTSNSCSTGRRQSGFLPSSLHKRTLSRRLNVSASPAASHGEEEPFSVREAAEGNPRWAFGAGIRRDFERRIPHYLSDFVDGFHPKALASVFFLFFACLAPCIAFGGVLSHVTARHIGVVETVIGTAGAGILYALTAGQPLTLLGPTGLMVVFCGLLYKVTVQMGLPFLPIYGWVGIWSCAFLSFLAAVEASDLIRHFTRFTDETFSALISLGYISEASKSIGNMFKQSSSYTMASSLLAVILAGGTWRLATFLTQLKSSRFLVRSLRNVLSDFGPPLAIFAMSCASHLLFPSVPLPGLSIPSTFSTTSGRPWQVSLLSIPSWAIVASMIPAALLTLLVFLDQGAWWHII
eukprot:c22094_g1_i4 orf=198-1544(+)